MMSLPRFIIMMLDTFLFFSNMFWYFVVAMMIKCAARLQSEVKQKFFLYEMKTFKCDAAGSNLLSEDESGCEPSRRGWDVTQCFWSERQMFICRQTACVRSTLPSVSAMWGWASCCGNKSAECKHALTLGRLLSKLSRPTNVTIHLQQVSLQGRQVNRRRRHSSPRWHQAVKRCFMPEQEPSVCVGGI